jgi:hypothetical protein
MPITCSNLSRLGYTEGCSNLIGTCNGNLDNFRGQRCGMMAMFYLKINSNLVTHFDEVDPVNWGEIISNLGGYWVYVGAGFSLFFAVKKGTLELIPSSMMTRLLGLCCPRIRRQKTPQWKRDEIF